MPRQKRIDIDSVLTEAMLRFWHYGYAATSMGDLVSAMGIPRQSVYNLFGSKRSLFLRALAHYDRTFVDAARVKLRSRDSPRAAVLELFADAVATATRDDRHGGCFVVNAALEMAPHDSDVAALVVGVFSAEEEFFRDLIVKGQALGEISVAVTPQQTAQSLLGLSIGIRVLARSRPEEHLLRALAGQAGDLLPASG